MVAATPVTTRFWNCEEALEPVANVTVRRPVGLNTVVWPPDAPYELALRVLPWLKLPPTTTVPAVSFPVSSAPSQS
jgi:hypothetical protein